MQGLYVVDANVGVLDSINPNKPEDFECFMTSGKGDNEFVFVVAGTFKNIKTGHFESFSRKDDLVREGGPFFVVEFLNDLGTGTSKVTSVMVHKSKLSVGAKENILRSVVRWNNKQNGHKSLEVLISDESNKVLKLLKDVLNEILGIFKN